MLRVDDWRLSRKTAMVRSFVSDPHSFPPFLHITLYGPFSLLEGQNLDVLYEAVESACNEIPGLSCLIGGWIRMRGRKGQAVAHDIRPSGSFRLFYDRLWQSLLPVTKSRSWIDRDPLQRRFHITQAYNLRTKDSELLCSKIREVADRAKIQEIFYHPEDEDIKNSGISEKELILLSEFAPLNIIRVALLKNGAVRGEFDMPSGDWLSRPLAYNKERKVVSMKQYRRLAGIELIRPPDIPEKPPFIVSDLHLGHENIIRYCRRPFSYAGEMDQVLIHNWNLTVREDDEVIFLGDLSYGPTARPAREYLSHLNGRIIFVRGNHDVEIPGTVPSVSRIYGGEEFLFVHTPGDAPPDFGGWIIHGHHHDNDLKNYPFIDFVHRRVNVSIELIGYRPISMDKVLSCIKNSRGRDSLVMLPVPGHGKR